MRTIYGLYDNQNDLERALRALEDLEIPDEQISVVTRDGEGRAGADSGAIAAGGATLGGLTGLLAGLGALGSLAIPGVGPILAVGTLGAALAGTAIGAGVGAAAGGLIGVLTETGVSRDEAEVYAEGVRRGGTLLSVTTPETQLDRVATVIKQTGAADVGQRRQQWQSEGWTGFGVDNADNSGARVERQDASETVGVPSPIATAAVLGMASNPSGTFPGGTAAGGAAPAAAVAAAAVNRDAADNSLDAVDTDDVNTGRQAGVGAEEMDDQRMIGTSNRDDNKIIPGYHDRRRPGDFSQDDAPIDADK